MLMASIGLLPEKHAQRLISTLHACGLPVYSPEMSSTNRRGRLSILDGLEEFRAHLGGELALTLPAPLGARTEIHSVDESLMGDCIAALADWK